MNARVRGFLIELVISCLALPFNGWVLFKSFEFVYGFLEQQKRKEKKFGSRKNRDQSYFLIYLTLMLNGMFFFITVVSSLVTLTYFIRVLNGSKVTPLRAGWGSFPWIGTLIVYMAVITALILMTLVGAERLSVTFKHTQYRLSNHTVILIRVLLFLTDILSAPPILTYAIDGFTLRMGVIYMISSPLALILFLPINVWIIRSFISNSKEIVRNMNDDHQSNIDEVIPEKIQMTTDNLSVTMTHSISSSSDSLKNTEASKLAHTALRVSIACFFPLITSSFVMAFSVIAFPSRSSSLIFVSRAMFPLDWSFNTFGILCTLKQAQPYYHFVFGRLHSFLFHWVFESNE